MKNSTFKTPNNLQKLSMLMTSNVRLWVITLKSDHVMWVLALYYACPPIVLCITLVAWQPFCKQREDRVEATQFTIGL